MKRENDFQKGLIHDIEEALPGAIVMKNDSTYIQGIPDLTVLYKDKWATLECKRYSHASKQPNQDVLCWAYERHVILKICKSGK